MKQEQWLQHRSLSLPLADAELDADLALPAGASGIVLFAHGSGSSRFSPRNRMVADYLNHLGLATLLLDLLTEDEHRIDMLSREFRFDIALLTRRLLAAIDHLRHDDELRQLPIGLFGASTGAAAALKAAAERASDVAAVVSRGGRTDLAGPALQQVKAPTLLIVGEWDDTVLALNRESARQLQGPQRLEVVPGATHLFEEPGKLEVVAELAGSWLLNHLKPQPE
ncbi:dienelactone hydrolase family protein [Pseudomonas sp. LS1212]|uniref:dienelactone hydrolase family protein n=1 Tax=Pseudomonas sp. LS1212 TaxID=2972478 RepID=UPI00215BE895|nr:dienelactone hydrolase family protein [Pseudomonas sp. LS1212]UVJ46363.1 dienelactone hydrolase family protein [Pseudomonas sp. LS1212]